MHCDKYTVLKGLFCSDKCKEEHRADPKAYERGEKELKKRIKELRRQDYIETQKELQQQELDRKGFLKLGEHKDG